MDVILLLHLYNICTFPTWLLRMRINSIFPLSRLLLQKIEIYLCIQIIPSLFLFYNLKQFSTIEKTAIKMNFIAFSTFLKMQFIILTRNLDRSFMHSSVTMNWHSIFMKNKRKDCIAISWSKGTKDHQRDSILL